MPITSLDYLMKRSTSGSIFSTDWQFTTSRVSVAGRWNDTSIINTPPSFVNEYPGTALTYVNCNSSSQFSVDSGPNVDEINGVTKHIIYSSAMSSVSTAVPGLLMLVDLQGYWPGISTDTTDEQTLSGTPTLRYNNGEGLKLYPVVTTATGAGTPSLSISYTNQSSTSGRSLSQTLAMIASATIGTLYHANPATANQGSGPFLPLANGDTGVQNVANVTFSAATAGNIALCLAKPLLTVPIGVIHQLVERDFVNQLTSLPRVYNGACLTWLYYTGAAAVVDTNVFGTLEMVWG
jgi:hypothetical protein